MVVCLVTSTSTGPIRRLTSVGPLLTRAVADAEAIGICMEFCASAKVGSIKPPPAKALASRNCRRDKLLSWCSFIVRRFPGEEVFKQRDFVWVGAKSRPKNKTFLD